MKNRPLKAWLESKNASNTDLPFLTLLNDDLQHAILDKVFDQFEVLRPTFSDGVKILELVTENILISSDNNNSLENLFNHSDTTDKWLKNLTALRFPITAARDASLEAAMISLPWPSGAKTKFERRGDRSGVELKLFITSPADLIKTIASLERVQKDLQARLKND